VTLACVAALGAAGCGGMDSPPVASACTAGPDTIVRALRAAPGDVALDDGTRLSDCIDRTRTVADLQNVGVAFSNAAEELERAASRDPRAALQLGYLVGATRRGTSVGAGIQDELLRRIERSADLDAPTPEASRALEQGLAAGERRG